MRVLYESTAELLHHESPSRGGAGGVEDIVRFIDRWKGSILAGDRYLNPNLTRLDSSCGLRQPGEEDWWIRWNEGLTSSHESRDMIEPPAMFQRPSDPLPPLPPLRARRRDRSVAWWMDRIHAPSVAKPTFAQRLRSKLRSIRSRIVTGADHRLLGDLVRAVDAVAARCDELSERAVNCEIVVDDLARILGEEVTRLHAAVGERTSEGSTGSSSRHA